MENKMVEMYKGVANHKTKLVGTLHTKCYESPQLAREAILKRVKKEGWGVENSDVYIYPLERKVIEETVQVIKSKFDQLETKATELDRIKKGTTITYLDNGNSIFDSGYNYMCENCLTFEINPNHYFCPNCGLKIVDKKESGE